MTIDDLTIKVQLEKKTMELFTIPVPTWLKGLASGNGKDVRVFDNPLEDNLRNYVAWGRLKPQTSNKIQKQLVKL